MELKTDNQLFPGQKIELIRFFVKRKGHEGSEQLLLSLFENESEMYHRIVSLSRQGPLPKPLYKKGKNLVDDRQFSFDLFDVDT